MSKLSVNQNQQNKNMKLNIRKTIMVAALCVATISLTGCIAQSVPRLKLSIDPVTHEVSLSNPKDTTIKNFHAEVTTNGTSIVTFDQLTTVMNPDVITTTGDAQAKLITATGQAVENAISTAETAMATSGASALVKH